MATTAPVLRLAATLGAGLRRFNEDRLGWMDRAAALGPVAGLRLGPVISWVVTDADVARRMLIAERDRWVRPPTIVHPVRLAVGENLFSQGDRDWSRLQPQLAPPFRARALQERLRDLDEVFREEVATLPRDVGFDAGAIAHRLVMIGAAWVMLGERLDSQEADVLVAHQRALVEWVGRRLGRIAGAVPIAIGPRANAMREHRRMLDEYAERVALAARRDGTGVVGALVEARRRRIIRSDRALRGQILGLLLAGSETTAAACMWALVHGSRNPEAWRAAANDSAHARAFVDETLRLSPPTWGIPRTPRRSTSLTAGDTTARVRPGAVANVYVRGINRDPRVWDAPEKFDPQRHLRATTLQSRAFLPFGLGPRACIGQHLALAELEILVRSFARLGPVAVTEPGGEDPHFALRPEDAVSVRVGVLPVPAQDAGLVNRPRTR